MSQSTGTLTTNGKSETAPTPPKKLQADAAQTVVYSADPVTVHKKANAVVLNWDQGGNQGVSIEVRTQNNKKWSDWTSIDTTDDDRKDDSPEDDTAASTIVLADKIDSFQYKVTLRGSSRAPSDFVSLTESTLLAIDSSKGPNGEPSTMQKVLGFLLPTASAATNQPSIISREAWGSPEPDWSSWKPEYAKLKGAIVHHTATTESSNSYADVRAIWYYHAKTRDWGDIGYHYLVDSKGRIFQGRYYDKKYASTNRLEVIGGHAYGHNVGTIGISAIGNYESKTLSTATKTAISKIIGYKLAPYRINPTSSGVVLGHYQVGSTSCPGKNIKSKLGAIQTEAKSYYDQYLPLFPFEQMQTRRWMKIARDTHKIDISTMQPVDGTLEQGSDLYFTDKALIDGTWYLRTRYDTEQGIAKGVLMSDVIDISPEPLAATEYYEITVNTRKQNPISEVVSSPYFTAGSTLPYTSKIVVNGKAFYRTKYDTDNGNNLYIPASQLKPAIFKSFETPRYMLIAQDTHKIDPYTGLQSDSVQTGQHVLFTSKIVTDQEYYRSKQDTDTSSNYAVPTAHIKDIPYETLGTEYKWLALTQRSQKFIPSQLQAIGPYIKPTDYPQLRIIQKITVNGQTFYRTAYDYETGANTALPADAFSEIPFVSFETPREMTTTRDITKINPSTGQTGIIVQKGTTLFFDSKIVVNNKLFARTATDTQASSPLSIPFDALKD
ncbi:MAG TPA: N-acetylmuramoyl-L-alanine amidase [Candidatus Saccharimonadales bacterium]